MKRAVALCLSIIFLALVLVGCNTKDAAVTDLVEPEPTPHSMTYNGTTTTWLYEIPCDMELPVGTLQLTAVYFGETKTNEGYSTVMHIEFTLPEELAEDQVKWFFKDDFNGYTYIGGDEEDIDVSFGYGKYGQYDTATETEIVGKTVYVVSKIQRNARYSVVGSNLRFIMDYETKDVHLSYCVETKITEDVTAHFDADGKTVDVGDAAATYIARRASAVIGK